MRRDIDFVEKLVIEDNLVQKLARWAQNEPSVHVLVLHGSRVRGIKEPGFADDDSDWDFQVVTSQPSIFFNVAWAPLAGLSPPAAYAIRVGRLGRINKISAIFGEGDVDIALLPFSKLLIARFLHKCGIIKLWPKASEALAELAMVLRPGMIFLKGTRDWRLFFEHIVDNFESPRLSDNDICALAEGFVCDYISIRGKVSRGELVAAQRWLHLQLAETNFRLLHELRLRLGQPSFPDARRLEFIKQDGWREAVAINASVDQHSLLCAVDRSAHVFRELVKALVGEKWRWPILPARLRRFTDL